MSALNITKVTKYITEDGQEFLNEKDAEAHAVAMLRRKELLSYLSHDLTTHEMAVAEQVIDNLFISYNLVLKPEAACRSCNSKGFEKYSDDTCEFCRGLA